MTIGRLTASTLGILILLSVVKLFFIGLLNIDSAAITILFWLTVLLVSIAVCRRMGIINFFEAFLLMGIWLIFSLLLDFILVAAILGTDIYNHVYLWVSYFIMMVAVFVFHKKRHVEKRKEYSVPK